MHHSHPGNWAHHAVNRDSRGLLQKRITAQKQTDNTHIASEMEINIQQLFT